jgi:hypothetical protein
MIPSKQVPAAADVSFEDGVLLLGVLLLGALLLGALLLGALLLAALPPPLLPELACALLSERSAGAI